VKFANIWIGINAGGGPTPDKPEVFLDVHDDPNRYDTLLNLRVADIQAVYDEWRGRGAKFLTPPLDNQGYELRCYLRDPTTASSRWAKPPDSSRTSRIEQLRGLFQRPTVQSAAPLRETRH
jgi:hypothetical protein